MTLGELLNLRCHACGKPIAAWQDNISVGPLDGVRFAYYHPKCVPDPEQKAVDVRKSR